MILTLMKLTTQQKTNRKRLKALATVEKVGKRKKSQRIKYLKILWRKKHTIDLIRRKVSTTESKMWKTDSWGKSTRGKRKWGEELLRFLKVYTP